MTVVNGMVPVEIASDAIGLARACEIHGASFFGNGARPGVILSTDQMLSPEAAENTRNQWERAHRGPDRAQRTAVLQGGLKVNELGGNNQESQFLEIAAIPGGGSLPRLWRARTSRGRPHAKLIFKYRTAILGLPC
jgi:phage portal protein BeeE